MAKDLFIYINIKIITLTLLILEENELDKNELNIYPNMQLSNFYLFNQNFFLSMF